MDFDRKPRVIHVYRRGDAAVPAQVSPAVIDAIRERRRRGWAKWLAAGSIAYFALAAAALWRALPQ